MLKKTVRISVILAGLCVLSGFYIRSLIPDTMYFAKNEDVGIKSLPVVALSPKTTLNSRSVHSGDAPLKYTARLFGVIPVKSVNVSVTDRRYVSVAGTPFGIKMFCDGVMVVGFSDILTSGGYKNPAKSAGLKAGDIIVAINGRKTHTNEDVEKIIEKYGNSKMKVSYIRNDKEGTTNLTAVKDINTDGYRSGMWVRDSGAGIGTMTFYDIENGFFAGLGHGIKDVDTHQELRLLSGEIVPVKITDVVKSKNGTAGQLKGSFTSAIPSGKILYNGPTGVCGKAYTSEIDNVMAVATPNQIQPGKAYILTTISGTQPRMYEIEIEKVNLTSNDMNKNMIIRITDSRLLALTGGIVRGFSGSPIIQNNRLVGAVTHVFVNQVDKGYGIFATNMLATIDNVAAKYENAA